MVFFVKYQTIEFIALFHDFHSCGTRTGIHEMIKHHFRQIQASLNLNS